MTASAGADPDLPLLARVGQGDAEAARALVARKLPRLLALATRMLGDPAEAEDVAQESFIRLWRQAPRWRADGGARIDTWLHRVALNLCYDRLRRREIAVATVPDSPDPGPAPDAALAAADEAGQVAAALRSLPDRQREAIVLHYYQDLSNIEAAALMEVSVEALESLLARARRRLRQLFREDDDGR